MKNTSIRTYLFTAVLCLLMAEKSTGTEDWKNRGFQLLKARQFTAAIEAFTKAIKADPNNAEAYNQRGVAWANQGDIDRAIADYTKAVNIDPELVGALNNRGSAFYRRGDYERAISDYTRALEINPYLDAVYSNRGTAWAGKGDYFRAITDYTQAIEVNPYFDTAYFNRGKTLAGIGDFDQAIADFKRAVDVNPTFDDAYNQLARILALCPEKEYRNGAEAVKFAKKAVELNPVSEFWDTLASAHAEAGQFAEALSAQRRAVDALSREGKTERLAEYKERLMAYAEHPRKRPNTIPAPAGTGVKKAASPKKTYAVQAGAFLSRQNAEEQKAFLIKRGYKAVLLTFTDSKGRQWHTIRIGNYERRKEAQKAAEEIYTKDKVTTSVRPSNSL